MTSDNPVTARLIRGIDQGRMRQLNDAARTTGIVLASVMAGLGVIIFLFPALGLIVVLILPLSILAMMALPVLVAVLAAGITHREITGENGMLLWVTPLETTSIADGFLDGVSAALEWTQRFGMALAAAVGLNVGLALSAYLTLLGDAAMVPPGSRSLLVGFVGFIILWAAICILTGGATWTANHAMINTAVRIGVAAGFRFRRMDSGLIRGIAGVFTSLIVLIEMVICSAAVWLPLPFAGLSANLFGPCIAGMAISGFLLSVLTRGIFRWVKSDLADSIEQARTSR
jgi:hypothetical protein